MMKKIVIKGAKEHNLKNVSVEIPKDKFVRLFLNIVAQHLPNLH